MTHQFPSTTDAAATLTAAFPAIQELLPAYAALADAYARAWGVRCVLADAQGELVAGETAGTESLGSPAYRALRQCVIDESVRWGEPAMLLCPRGSMLWAVPVMVNAHVLGGLLAEKTDAGVSGVELPALTPLDMHRAALALLAMAEQANLTNAALLELRRMAARRESERADAIHELKEQNYQSIRDIYLVEEPSLITAIKRGDRATARGILNRVLVGIYFMGRNKPQLLKSFLLELVVTMSRSAVEAGGDPTELLGANYSSFTDLAHSESEEELCQWLVGMLERIMDAIKVEQHLPAHVLVSSALQYMQEHLQEDLSRDEVARVACLSPSHFSRMVKQTFGHSFTDLLAKLRIDRSREMLVLTEKSLIDISLDCGFSDQSYFTKVFQKFTGRTPSEYRRLHRSTL